MVLSETAENQTGEDFVHLSTLKMLLASQIKVLFRRPRGWPALQSTPACANASR